MMKKLRWFDLLIIYALGIIAFSWLSSLIGVPYLLTAVFDMALFIFSLFWLKRTCHGSELFNKISYHKAPDFLILLLLILVTSFNYILIIAGKIKISPSVKSIPFLFTLVLAAFFEELFFRGFIYSALKKKNTVLAIILTSILFAALHSIDFLTEMDYKYTLAQIIYALITGIIYAFARNEFSGITECVISHVIINVGAAALTL